MRAYMSLLQLIWVAVMSSLRVNRDRHHASDTPFRARGTFGPMITLIACLPETSMVRA